MDERPERCSFGTRLFRNWIEEVTLVFWEESITPLSLVEELNKIGGENGFGRVDHGKIG